MNSDRPLGLLAGSGRFPIAFAKAARRQGQRIFCIGVEGMASEELREHCDEFTTSGLAKLGRGIKLFRRAGVSKIVMAGKIDKTPLVRRYLFWRVLPDWRTLHMWFRYAAQNKKDDTLLLAVIREFERDQLTFDSALNYCSELLVKHGFLTRRKPNPTQWKDINFGWELAKEMGRLDVGQSVMVKETAVLAIEAIEGTERVMPQRGLYRRQGRQAAAGHAVRRADDRHADDSHDARSRRAGAGNRKREDDHARPGRGAPPGRPVWNCDRGTECPGDAIADFGIAA
jgi:DUF1009 family protein